METSQEEVAAFVAELRSEAESIAGLPNGYTCELLKRAAKMIEQLEAEKFARIEP